MPKRRISIPEGHVALVLTAMHADELLSVMQSIRRAGKTLRLNAGDNLPAIRAVADDIVLALLDAKEAI